jgi:hypothetical protein
MKRIYVVGHEQARSLFDVNTSLSSVPDTMHVQKLQLHEIGTNSFRKHFYDVIV